MRERTGELHRRAERSGIVAEIVAGRISRAGYSTFLRNLLPAYQALESGLEGQRATPGMSGLIRPEVFRAKAIAEDLSFLVGSSWHDLALLPIAIHYAERIVAAAKEAPELLIAHAYTRYLGDLGGGRALERILRSALDLDGQGLAFYAFPQVTDVRALAGSYRSAIDFAAKGCSNLERVVDEAVDAFHLNIALSETVAASLRAHEATSR
jgi:heme oxygenase